MCSSQRRNGYYGELFHLSLSLIIKKKNCIKILDNQIYVEINLLSWCIHPAWCVFVAHSMTGVECEMTGLSAAKIDEMG